MPAVSGTTKNSSGTLCSMLVRAYRRDTGAFVGQALSHPTTGEWSIETVDTSKHFALAHGSVAVGSQPYLLAITGNGPNNSTNIVDMAGKPITAVGDARIVTAQSLFNGSSIAFDGTDYLSVPDSADWDFGTGDVTGEGYFRFESHIAGVTLFGNYQDATTGFAFQWRSDTNGLSLTHGNTELIGASWTPTDGTFHHLAFCIASGSLRLFAGGTQVGSTVACSADITGSTNPLLIGALNASGSFVQRFTGNACGICIKKEALYTSNFTPPVGIPYTIPSATENALCFDDLTPI